VVSAHDDGDARSAMADGCCGLAQRTGKEKEKQMARRVRRAGARGALVTASSARMPVVRGLREQKASDGWHTRGAGFLNSASHCRSRSVD